MLGLRPDANTQWNRKPSPKPSSSDSSWAKESAPISKAARDSANALNNFGSFMRDPIENAGGKRLYIGMHGAWNARGMGTPALVTLFACAGAHIATFTADKG